EFVFPGGPVRTRFVRLISKNSSGASGIGLSPLNVLAVGAVASIVSFPPDNNLARRQSPAAMANGAQIVATSDGPAGDASALLLSGTGQWTTVGTTNEYAIIQLAGGKVYTLDGVRFSSNVKDLEVWVSATTTDATAFARVFSANQVNAQTFTTFTFPSPVQARYLKLVMIEADRGAPITTGNFDVIAEGVVGIAGSSNPNGSPEQTLDPNPTGWQSAGGQVTNQFIKVQLAGSAAHDVYGVQITPFNDSFNPNLTGPKDFHIRVP